LIIPWRVDVPRDRTPYMNWLIASGIIAAFGLEIAAAFELTGNIATQREPSDEPLKWMNQFVLDGWGLKGLFGHMWLHGGLIHLLGNLLFLWVFGNAVCAKIGNLRYLPIYIGLGLAAAISHLVFSGGQAIGASGAINGMVGMFLVFFPENDITCYWVWWFYLYPKVVEFTLSSYWMILFWFAFDLLGAFFSSGQMGGVAYFAHVGGFVAGAAIAVALLKTNLVVMEPRYEKSLLRLIAEKRNPPEPEPDPRYRAFEREIESTRELEKEKAQWAEPPPAAPAPVQERHPTERRIAMDEKPKDDFIRFRCSCGRKVKISSKYAGRSGKCPHCSRRLRIPES